MVRSPMKWEHYTMSRNICQVADNRRKLPLRPTPTLQQIPAFWAVDNVGWLRTAGCSMTEFDPLRSYAWPRSSRSDYCNGDSPTFIGVAATTPVRDQQAPSGSRTDQDISPARR